ncbi:MAG TPA: hypothetical protein VJX10_22605 [Pseudonocardiaceae bacterium]|nr:hypothetical protein [Pseudonocardiaceae bacterium]
MPRIGITGHTGLSSATTTAVSDALRRELRHHRTPELHGITCLAPGTDQLFARAVLAEGGTFEVVLPATDYRDSALRPGQRPEFDDLLARATSVTYMPFAESGRSAYLAASLELLRRSDVLFAVWDGTRTGRTGESGEVVAEARARHLPVRVVWPDNAVRILT